MVDRFEFDGIRMVTLTPEGAELELMLKDCEVAFRRTCEERLGAGNNLANWMNEATDNLRKFRNLPVKDQSMGTPAANPRIEPAYLDKAISYEAYVQLIDDLVTTGRTTGPDQSAALIHYTVLNQQRMRRWEKTIQILPSAETAMRGILNAQTWLVLTEAWCGDAAHSIPVLQALARLNQRVTLRFLCRDENPGLMDRYLTNGVSRSIPKLIAMDTTTGDELFTWGSRPAPLQALFMKLKEEGTAYAAIKEELQRWYNKDKSLTIQQEMAALVSKTLDSNFGMTA